VWVLRALLAWPPLVLEVKVTQTRPLPVFGREPGCCIIVCAMKDRSFVKEIEQSLLTKIGNPAEWYKDPEAVQKLSRTTLEVVSSCPSQVEGVCEALVRALSTGSQDPCGAYLNIGGRTFQSRSDLKAECRLLLQRYPDGSHLDQADAAFVRELLLRHPRGSEKARDLQAVSVGMHPNPMFETRCFLVVRKGGVEDFSYVRCVDNAPTCEVVAQERICEALYSVLQIQPNRCGTVAGMMEERFPPTFHMNTTVEVYRNWVHCILWLCTRMPEITEFILIILVRQMCEIDAQMAQLEDALDGDPEEVNEDTLDRMAQILDATMMLFFEYLQRRLAGQVDVEGHRLVSLLLGIFESTVLLTHKTRCVQFLFFYIASLRPSWTEAFLSVLLQTAYSPVQAMTKRIISFSYLASFVSRASFLTTKYALRTTQYVSTFAREQQQVAEALMSEGEFFHPQVLLFLCAIQAVCYILCFKASTFAVETEDGQNALGIFFPPPGAEIGKEAFTPVLDSVHRPLSRISEHVAKQFVRSLRPHIPATAEAARQAAQTDGKCSDEEEYAHNSGQGLEAFFPYDPYRLRHSHIFLLGIYQQWVSSADADDSEESDMEDAPVPGGFEAETACNRGRASSLRSASDADDEAHSDADFTDMADVAERGFIPSVGPSPAFRPRASDMVDVSPLTMPMESTAEDDSFSLPQASMDVGASNAILNCLLKNPAYMSSRGCRGENPLNA